MKNDEILYPPKQVKVDTITDEEAYLKDKLKDKRAEYELIIQSQKQPGKLYRVLYVLSIIILIVGFALNNNVKPQYLGLIIISIGALIGIIGLALSPRKRYDVNPFEFRLTKPITMEAVRESKKNNNFRFVFDCKDCDGKSVIAITEGKYSEEEKEKICKSFINGTVVVAIDKKWNAEILEY